MLPAGAVGMSVLLGSTAPATSCGAKRSASAAKAADRSSPSAAKPRLRRSRSRASVASSAARAKHSAAARSDWMACLGRSAPISSSPFARCASPSATVCLAKSYAPRSIARSRCERANSRAWLASVATRSESSSRMRRMSVRISPTFAKRCSRSTATQRVISCRNRSGVPAGNSISKFCKSRCTMRISTLCSERPVNMCRPA